MIIRTVAEGKQLSDLKRDLESQLRLWKRLEKKIKSTPTPSLILKDMSTASSIIRDLFTKDIDSLVVDSKRFYHQIGKYLSGVAPHLLDKVKLYTDRKPIFDAYRIESEIEKTLSRKVWLNGGGYIMIDQTEALVTIDVNSGRFMGKANHEENSLRVNLRAAREICRQLRLRDLGGIIVIDFIDMVDEKNRKKVYDEMKKELKKDRSKTDISSISQFGLMEMTRQRIKPSLIYTFNETCPTCNGAGMIASMETVTTQLERWIKRFTSTTREKRIEITVNSALYDYLTAGITNWVRKMMLKSAILIRLKKDENLKADEFVCYSPKQDKIITNLYRF
jgi:ribonuclease G